MRGLDRPLRVLSIANTLVYGGDENRLLSLATYVNKARVEHHVAVLKRADPVMDARYGSLRPEFAARGIDIIEIGEQRLDRGEDSSMLRKLDRTAASLWRSVRKTVALVKALKVDVIDGHIGSGNRVAVAAGLLTGTPAVVTTYFAEFFKPEWLSNPSEKLMLRGAHTIVTDSIERACAIERFLSPSKPRIALVANGIRPVLPTRPHAEVQAALGVPGDPKTVVVGQIAGLVESKGWYVLLEAARIALRQNANLFFLCVGKERQEPGFQARLQARAEELGIAGRVRIGGYDGAIGDVWQLLDIHAHASLFDSLPNAIIEGMSVGKPAIVTSVGDVATLIADCETGFVVAPGDAQAFANRLVELGVDGELRARMGRTSKARYEARYRPEMMAEALEDIFVGIAAERCGIARARTRARMNVLVSGAGGFIGSRVVRALVRAGYGVRAHLGAPDDPVVPAPSGVESLQFDIGDDSALQHAARGADAVVHLAGPAAVAPSFDDPAGYARAHVAGTASVIAAMERAHLPNLVYVSSAEVYGRPECDPVTEDAPLAPRSPYGAAKAGAELIVASAVRRGGLARAVVLRPFSVYGPGQRANSLLAGILRQSATESEIFVDDLRPVRDYVFVEDVAAAVVSALGGRSPGIITANIGGGRGVSVAELATAAARAAGRDVTVRERGASRPAAAEISRLVADIARAREEFGWQPAVDLAEGLRRTIAQTAAA